MSLVTRTPPRIAGPPVAPWPCARLALLTTITGFIAALIGLLGVALCFSIDGFRPVPLVPVWQLVLLWFVVALPVCLGAAASILRGPTRSAGRLIALLLALDALSLAAGSAVGRWLAVAATPDSAGFLVHVQQRRLLVGRQGPRCLVDGPLVAADGGMARLLRLPVALSFPGEVCRGRDRVRRGQAVAVVLRHGLFEHITPTAPWPACRRVLVARDAVDSRPRPPGDGG